MYNVGIFEVIAENGQLPVTGNWPNGVFVSFKQISVPVLLRAGFVEIINKSPYDLALTLSPGGSLVQDSGSKCIYRLTQGGQGLSLTAQPPNNTSGNFLTNVLLTPPNNTIIVNNYEEDEIEWYPPVSLNTTVPPLQQQFGYLNYQFLSNSNVTNASPLTTAASNAAQQIFLLGFDATLNPNSTAGTHALTISGLISNFFQGSNNTLTYQMFDNTTTASALIVKFPCPILVGNSGATFTPSVTFPTPLSINVYWIVQ